jgi:hypothetical protein
MKKGQRPGNEVTDRFPFRRPGIWKGDRLLFQEGTISRRVAGLEGGSLDRLERRGRPDGLSLLFEVLVNQLQSVQLGL